MRNASTRNSSDAPAPAQDSRPTDVKRRRFLFTLGAGGAGAAAAVAGALPGAVAAQDVAAPTDDRNAAYRATEHVRDYYRTAKI
jgi:hypothetical protein